jgi:membrane-associated PAP2 superfamily phosphatase
MYHAYRESGHKISRFLALVARENLYSSTSIIGMIKSRRMRWAWHVARMGEKRNAYRILEGKPDGKRPLGNQDVGGWTILEWILER